ncbi:MAG TPA: histidinol phosphate phosphatase domain-containing protein [Spirochaetota bacterium]|nr:histidinol phosphate phosphatase domain-containing protein [Spirochaetota bacterium]HOL57784.1 histidinol phosphate phosphatase domain-containing protein [Spirochaetota bacterium]HPP05404.1 histidinol phosphate phosphatase domain-containing protein [Spirochaetota bacterium]
MIDFHTHTFLSDGALSPAEHIRRAYCAGYKIIGITDHVDFSNVEFVFNSIKKIANEIKDSGWDIKVIPGVEITHVPARKIGKIISICKEMGVPLIIVHGESPVEPVEKMTNREAIENGAHILAHPGLITEEDVIRARERGVYLEITAKKGHNTTNGYVAKLAKKHKAKLVCNSDAHIHTEFLTLDFRNTVLLGSGLEKEDIEIIDNNMKELAEKFLISSL